MIDFTPTLYRLVTDIVLFTDKLASIKLRNYQKRVAYAIIDSILNKKGHSFVIIFPRQSGKNELQAHIEAYVLTLLKMFNAEIVKVSPTWKPQSQNAMRRLERVLNRNLITFTRWRKEQGYIFRIENASIYFLSAQPSANIVGATASTLLECDEAQDVLITKWDKEINPMAASTNATRVFWGTAWTSNTLLAREKRAALKAQEQDGEQRVFQIDAQEVGAEVPPYLKFVESEIRKLGRNHPFVRSQYFSEEIDSEGGMFPPSRQALMRGEHPMTHAPEDHCLYAFLIDVAGQDEAASLDITEEKIDLLNKNRDSHTLTIVEVDLSTLDDELIQAPRYLVRHRKLWTGNRHTTIYGQIKALVELWQPRYLVIDATGIGAGLSSFFERAFPEKVIPFIFNASTKSKLGWDFLSVIETGRFKDHVENVQSPEAIEFWRQVQHTVMEIRPGPNRTMQWGVPDGTRDQASGDLIHDDLVISAALCTLLDNVPWGHADSAIIHAPDPLAGLGEVF